VLCATAVQRYSQVYEYKGIFSDFFLEQAEVTPNYGPGATLTTVAPCPPVSEVIKHLRQDLFYGAFQSESEGQAAIDGHIWIDILLILSGGSYFYLTTEGAKEHRGG
jgi:hypothetical protein